MHGNHRKAELQVRVRGPEKSCGVPCAVGLVVVAVHSRVRGHAHTGHLTGHRVFARARTPQPSPNLRSEYALAGDVVNLAARLAAASEKGENGVLCDEATLESLTGEVCEGRRYP